ncbi:rod-binding protein [Rhizobium sp. AC27/96]|uniref:rod-binding protein n=1 Tax=Rhizobium TaxID=379 RepID=UPI00082778AA|nr:MULTISPECIES: rod-binding protein [Rhizobium]NTF40931.1 rod-binding protein [Rhizobium rhizogenes]OCI96745.1 rod-binding protein [Rhizobium sp. AC27/96]
MAISPPSDLVLDVVKAANPADVEVAQAKLAANKAAFAATSLAENGSGFGAAFSALNSAATQAGLANANTHSSPTKVPQVYRKFEAMMMQNFVKNMLPSSETLYGKGSAGEIWKGMMAEQLGNTIAKNGGVGIAEKMYQEQVTKMRNTGAINSATNENDKKMALSAVTDFQRKTLAATDASDGDTSITNQNTLTSQKA